MGILLLLLLFLSILLFSLMFERSIRPSLQLGISLCEAALMVSSSRFHSKALSHSLWLLSALLAFVRLQGFSPADASLFNTLVTSLISAWNTRPLSLLLSLPSSVSSALTSISPIFLSTFLRRTNGRCWLLLWFVPVLSLLSLMWLACWRTPRRLRRCALSRCW